MWRILVSAVVAIVPLSAQISRESLLRYGEPYVQRFRTAPEISITVRYGPTGEVCAVRIAPAESAGTEAPPQDGFDALTVNAVAKRFVSGSRDPHDEGRQAPSSELSLEEQSDGWRVARYHGYPIRRRDPLFGEVTRAWAARQ